MTPRLLPCGPTATMVEVETVAQAAALAAHVRGLTMPGIVDIVPAARTVLVITDSSATLEPLVLALQTELAIDIGIDIDIVSAADGPLVEVPTVYGGEDLAEVSKATGLSLVAVIDAHSSTEYVAAFCGFSPGFVYLTGLVEALQLPRRRTPRARVPAGSVAIGAEFSGVYPRDSPGGWHLIGHTATQMWDPGRARPSHISPGDRVRFVPVLP